MQSPSNKPPLRVLSFLSSDVTQILMCYQHSLQSIHSFLHKIFRFKFRFYIFSYFLQSHICLVDPLQPTVLALLEITYESRIQSGFTNFISSLIVPYHFDKQVLLSYGIYNLSLPRGNSSSRVLYHKIPDTSLHALTEPYYFIWAIELLGTRYPYTMLPQISLQSFALFGQPNKIAPPYFIFWVCSV